MGFDAIGPCQAREAAALRVPRMPWNRCCYIISPELNGRERVKISRAAPIGGSFDLVAGKVRPVPLTGMQGSGFEWLYRIW